MNHQISRFGKSVRVLIAFALVILLAGAALVGKTLEPTPTRMTEAAKAFLQQLSTEQRNQTVFPFDNTERFAWHFVPLQTPDKQPRRKGLRLEVMNENQKNAALELIRSGLSDSGFEKIKTIFSLEDVLKEEEKGRGPVRNPGWYFLTIYGQPSMNEPWGWRVDGHHVALNFTLDQGNVTSLTPAFFGSNPAEVREGSKQGTRPLGQRFDLAGALAQSLTDEQKSKAKQSKNFSEVQGQTKAAKVGEPAGINYAQLQPAQQEALRKLLDNYLDQFAADLAAAERQRVESAGYDKLSFAYSGTFEKGAAVTYRIQGLNLLVEFLNVQPDGAGNKNNHYHSSWRSLPSDFGLAKNGK